MSQTYAHQSINSFFYKNGANISLDLSPYVTEIVSDEFYDSNVTPNKLEWCISAEYPGTWNWNDEIYSRTRYNHDAVNPSFLTETCTVDFLEAQAREGDQTYTISALGENLELLVDEGDNKFNTSNKTMQTFLNEFATFAGVTLSTNVPAGIMLGTVEDAVTPAIGNYESRIAALRDSFARFGFIGSLTRNTLKAFMLSQPTDTPVVEYNYYRLISVTKQQSVNTVARYYLATFINRTGGDVITDLNLNNNFTSIGNNTRDLTSEGIYYNYDSAYFRTLGEMYRDLYDSNKYTITFMGLYIFKAGDYFNLPGIFSPTYEGLYINLRTTHRVTKRGWITVIEAFKLSVLEGIVTNFRLYPLDESYNIG